MSGDETLEEKCGQKRSQGTQVSGCLKVLVMSNWRVSGRRATRFDAFRKMLVLYRPPELSSEKPPEFSKSTLGSGVVSKCLTSAQRTENSDSRLSLKSKVYRSYFGDAKQTQPRWRCRRRRTADSTLTAGGSKAIAESRTVRIS